jgi:alkanesulfonate monooxygenase SsuD/methylene tetrahydromethanopterin reductase-like flavin-dependent oxidoreductase (luciferase family)
MTARSGSDIRVGVELMNEAARWSDVRSAVVRADSLGLDSLWTWDHLMPVNASPHEPVLEGWALLAAWAAITRHPTVGLMVGANTLRHPGVVAKSAVTVDHISNGRCVLGLGAGSQPKEHHLHGIPHGALRGERFSWLEEAIEAIRALLAGKDVRSLANAHYQFAGARHAPAPVRGSGRLPILVGGSGARRTLPIVARQADIWNPGAPTTEFNYVRERSARLDELCDRFGRDPATIERTLDPVIMIRASRLEAQQALEPLLAGCTVETGFAGKSEFWVGPPEAIASRFQPFMDVGFTHLIAGLPAPYDAETIEGMAEVRRLLSTDGSPT